ncbi:MAG: hypothetical protein QXE01_07305 [Sulfolobales archaeon]
MIGILERASEGTSIYRVLEGISVLASLAILLILDLAIGIHNILYPVAGVISIYGSHHLRRCRNLYQGYLWGIEGMGYLLDRRGLYMIVIRAIFFVEIFLIALGISLIIYPVIGYQLLGGYGSYILLASLSSFASVAIIGHFTRVELYRIFIEKVRRGG